MNSYQDVFTLFGGVGPLADAVDMTARIHTVRSWRQRDSIPPEYWAPVSDAAKSLGITGVTVSKLAALRTGASP